MTALFLAGAGFIAREHANAAFDPAVVADRVVLHVADPNPAALASFLAEYPTAIGHADAGEMFGHAEPGDLAIIATPPVTHLDLVHRALQAGLHVLCEKPLAMSVDEAVIMAKEADARGLMLDSCDSRFRGLATTQEVRRIIAEGDLGLPYHVTFVNALRRARTGIDSLTSSSWFRDPRVSGGGVLMDWGPYDIAVLDEILQPVRVEIPFAWARSPRTGGPFALESEAAEQHVGAAMVAETESGLRVAITYERAAATHGVERTFVQIEADSGAVAWDWLDWAGENSVRVTRDVDGAPVSTTTFAPPELGYHSRPLARTLALLDSNTDARAVTGRSIFTFTWLRAIMNAAETGLPQTVVASTPARS